ncbi:CYTH domain-containing protein [Tenuibacillus multivorans]|uniref:Uncharacterized protein YjbK n=1 Tax=Tenuibacillus multivorans TaxID=237069 RepID=A0A1H0EI09_9BACI|nr:CYTH domain-containing protein [Tenuibacillus multivorans]GEL77146.1 CYTH domain-containing protein [Tenuibacillus multivorans]SDN82094.1 Uncharacterized protein YjbK [Tenuibacillus multivorans]
MNEIEIEFKNLLSKQQYNQLKHHWFNHQQPIRQTNYYFETDDFQLKQHDAALRIREKNHNYIATLKQPHEDGLLETHDALTHEEAYKWFHDNVQIKENILTHLKQMKIDVNQIHFKGSLTTHRLEKRVNDFNVVLDYSEYHHTEDYELEVEAPSYQQGKTFFKELLERYNIQPQPTKNKIQRFFESLS